MVYSGNAKVATSYFSTKVETYDRYRPSYPPAVIDAIHAGLPPYPVIVDVGCGTGISTRALAREGTHVSGIEPNDEMRRAAEESGESVAGTVLYQQGTGEETGLAAGFADAVVCAQSFHWFDAGRALREFHRILKQGGRLALIWNVRDESTPSSAEYERIIRDAQAAALRVGRIVRHNRSGNALTDGWFQNVRESGYPNSVRYRRDEFLGRARSSSYWPESGAVREELEARLMHAFDAHAVNGVVELAQVCSLTQADRADRREASSGH